MSERTLEELREAINGKEIMFSHSDHSLTMSAICIVPPGGIDISIKPYGIDAKEVLEKLHLYGARRFTLEDVEAPEFCLGLLRIAEQTRGDLQALADAEIEALVVLGDNDYTVCSTPKCPYG